MPYGATLPSVNIEEKPNSRRNPGSFFLESREARAESESKLKNLFPLSHSH